MSRKQSNTPDPPEGSNHQGINEVLDDLQSAKHILNRLISGARDPELNWYWQLLCDVNVAIATYEKGP